MKRTQRVYPISENELDTIGSLSIHAIVAFSVASMLLTTILGLWLDGLTSPSTTPIGQAVYKYGPYVFGAIALVSVAYGGVMWKKRGTKLKKIKEESTEIPISAGGGSAGDENMTVG